MKIARTFGRKCRKIGKVVMEPKLLRDAPGTVPQVPQTLKLLGSAPDDRSRDATNVSVDPAALGVDWKIFLRPF